MLLSLELVFMNCCCCCWELASVVLMSKEWSERLLFKLKRSGLMSSDRRSEVGV